MTFPTYARALLEELSELDTLADVDAVLLTLMRPGNEVFIGELRRRWFERGGARG